MLAEILLEDGKPGETSRLVAALAESKDRTYSDWAVLRRAVDGAPSADLATVRDRVLTGKDAPSLRLLADLERREKHDKRRSRPPPPHRRAARDDCAAHLALAHYLRAKRTVAS